MLFLLSSKYEISFIFTSLNASLRPLFQNSSTVTSNCFLNSSPCICSFNVFPLIISFSTRVLISSINFYLFFLTTPPSFNGVYSLKSIFTAYLLVIYPATPPEILWSIKSNGFINVFLSFYYC